MLWFFLCNVYELLKVFCRIYSLSFQGTNLEVVFLCLPGRIGRIFLFSSVCKLLNVYELQKVFFSILLSLSLSEVRTWRQIFDGTKWSRMFLLETKQKLRCLVRKFLQSSHFSRTWVLILLFWSLLSLSLSNELKSYCFRVVVWQIKKTFFWIFL